MGKGSAHLSYSTLQDNTKTEINVYVIVPSGSENPQNPIIRAVGESAEATYCIQFLKYHTRTFVCKLLLLWITQLVILSANA
jgi:hypothetical protein